MICTVQVHHHRHQFLIDIVVVDFVVFVVVYKPPRGFGG
jgi:hypothetical protein